MFIYILINKYSFHFLLLIGIILKFYCRKGSRKGEIVYTWPASLNKQLPASPPSKHTSLHAPRSAPPPPPGYKNGHSNGNGHHYNGYPMTGVK